MIDNKTQLPPLQYVRHMCCRSQTVGEARPPGLYRWRYMPAFMQWFVDIFQNGVTSLRWRKWLTETGAVTSQINDLTSTSKQPPQSRPRLNANPVDKFGFIPHGFCNADFLLPSIKRQIHLLLSCRRNRYSNQISVAERREWELPWQRLNGQTLLLSWCFTSTETVGLIRDGLRLG